jgi:hypothetical protein
MAFKWIKSGAERPPTKERLLLIVSAAGEPPDVRLMGTSEIIIGYWTGEYFRPVTAEYPFGTDLKVSYWAALRNLPRGTVLKSRREFGDDVRE